MSTPTIAPGAAFIATVAVASGIHIPAPGRPGVPQLLLTHPGPRRARETTATVEAGMRDLAASLGLDDGRGVAPDIGCCVILRCGLVALDYGHDRYVMTIPSPGETWRDLMLSGSPCRIALVVGPIPAGLGQAAVDQRVRGQAALGRVLWGTAYARMEPLT